MSESETKHNRASGALKHCAVPKHRIRTEKAEDSWKIHKCFGFLLTFFRFCAMLNKRGAGGYPSANTERYTFCRIILFCLIRAKMDQHPFDTVNGVFSARCFQAASFERAEKAVPVTRVRLLFSHTGFSCSGAAMRLPERRNPAEHCPLPRSGCCIIHHIYI